ncbi:MAG TPA: hypothetical protein VF134_00700 [Candidatus Dormibacteraeota bacterium]
MRFPFTLMGLISMIFGGWIFLYLAGHRPEGPVSGGMEVAIAFTMVAFGSWVIWRRVTRGRAA